MIKRLGLLGFSSSTGGLEGIVVTSIFLCGHNIGFAEGVV
jgi:hypothetical protein